MLGKWFRHGATQQPSVTLQDEDEFGELRGSPRISVVKRAGVVSVDGIERAALVRNLSAGGLMAETHAKLNIGDKVAVGLSGYGDLHGIVRWRRGNEFGMAFDDIHDLDVMIASGSQWRAGAPVNLRFN